MSKYGKPAALALLPFSLLFSVLFTLDATGVLLKAQTIPPAGTPVIPIFPKTNTDSKNTIQLKDFGFITLTPNPLAPAGSTGTGSNGPAVWPFPTKSPAQYRRIDAGWDLQYHKATPVLAVASGTIRIAGNNPGGFGVDYPLLTLDYPVCGYPAIYYGHVHVNRKVMGKHVNAGDIIAYTDPNGVNSPSNWAEPGFWKSGPAGNGKPYPTPQGLMMKKWLLTNKCS